MTPTDRLFNRSPVGMALHDTELRYTRVNDAMAEMSGLTALEMLGRTPTELHGLGAGEAEDHMRTVLQTGRPVQALELTGTASSRPDDLRRWMFTCFALGDGTGLAVFLGDVTERRRTESWLTRQHARNALLATAARELDPASGVQGLAQRVAELAVPSIADWALVELAQDDGAVDRVGVAHADPQRTPALHELARTGHPANGLAARVDELELRTDVELVVPLRARGRTIGRVVLGAATSDRRFGDDELVTARMLAEHAALALDGALVTAGQARVAHELQAGLLPPVLPTVPELELAARYRAAGAGAEVGGDFYDAFAAGEDWVVIIGDVAGKGPAAAAITGLARHTLRAAARYERDPSDALFALNDAMLQQLGGQRHCTAALVRLEIGAARRSGETVVRAAVRCAGHPPPLVLRAGGTVEAIGRPGHPLGILEAPTFRDDSVLLSPGDALVLYTDGVTDAGGGDAGLGEDGLARVVGQAAGLAPAALLERIETEVSERGSLRDDIALLAVRVR